MEKDSIDWGVLKTAIIVFTICLILSCSLAGASYYYYKQANKELRLNKNQFQSISRRYLDVDQEEKLVRDYYPKFVKLYNNGVIGRENRLNWIESLRQSGEKIKLPSLKYSIKSQESYIPGYAINYSGFSLYRSNMELNLGLLHEGDLFKLLNYINHNAKGIYTVSDCSFSMIGVDVVFEKNHPNINASCNLYWITINVPGGKGIEI